MKNTEKQSQSLSLAQPVANKHANKYLHVKNIRPENRIGRIGEGREESLTICTQLSPSQWCLRGRGWWDLRVATYPEEANSKNCRALQMYVGEGMNTEVMNRGGFVGLYSASLCWRYQTFFLISAFNRIKKIILIMNII